jgi:hypothetical protein
MWMPGHVGIASLNALHLVTCSPAATAPHSAIALWMLLLRFVGAAYVPQRHQPQSENDQAALAGLFESSASISPAGISKQKHLRKSTPKFMI